jgi:isoleucyl-tRNA synthetase
MEKNLSVHLQNFPDTSFIDQNKQLIKDMDLIREICAAILFIRDQRNLRVRLPLNKVTIYNYGNNQESLSNIKKIKSYQDLIKDEVNVKNIEIITIVSEDEELAEFKLELNFKKIGSKLGSRMKEIGSQARLGNWQKITDNKIKISDIFLEGDDFSIKLIAKDKESSAPLPSNDCLVKLDLNITKELKDEGIARDIIRAIQQNRKDADLNVSDYIKILIITDNQEYAEVIDIFKGYIKEQTLSSEIKVSFEKDLNNNYKFEFNNKIEETTLTIQLNMSNEL